MLQALTEWTIFFSFGLEMLMLGYKMYQLFLLISAVKTFLYSNLLICGFLQ